MDLTTIKKRLENYYYYSGKECILDFKIMFNNCRIFNKPSSRIILSCDSLHTAFQQSISGMPSEEKEIPKLGPVKPFGDVERPLLSVNGQVFPPTIPGSDKLVRKTNQLDYIKNTVMKQVLEHEYAWPFLDPVDAVKLNLPVS